jgi:hypothetical protein
MTGKWVAGWLSMQTPVRLGKRIPLLEIPINKNRRLAKTAVPRRKTRATCAGARSSLLQRLIVKNMSLKEDPRSDEKQNLNERP